MEALRQRLSQMIPVSDEMWADVMDQASIVHLKKGDILLRAGEICHNTWFISEGLVRMYYLKDGVEHIRQFFFENGLMADFVSSFTQSPSRLYLDALEDTRLIAMPATMLNRYPAFKEIALIDSLYHVSNRMASIFLDSPEDKYRDLIKGRPKVIQRIPQYMIAAYIGVTPEGLSRIKRRMRKEEKGNRDQ